jgi:hypothetical protein
VYDEVRSEIVSQLLSMDDYCDSKHCPQAHFSHCILRMAGHDFLDYKANEGGGSDGCIDFHDANNVGLEQCLTATPLAQVYGKFCTRVSFADFLVIAAESILELSSKGDVDGEINTNAFQKHFKFGRKTSTSCRSARGRLPNPAGGCSATETVYGERLGLTWRETAALKGVFNSWSDGKPKNERKFNNHFFATLVGSGWVPTPDRKRWVRTDGGRDTVTEETMGDADMCLVWKDAKREGCTAQGGASCFAYPEKKSEITARHSDCCSWVSKHEVQQPCVENDNGDPLCTDFVVPEQKNHCGGHDQCCQPDSKFTLARTRNCANPKLPGGAAYSYVRMYAADQQRFFTDFTQAWTKATEVGQGHLQCITPECLIPPAKTVVIDDGPVSEIVDVPDAEDAEEFVEHYMKKFCPGVKCSEARARLSEEGVKKKREEIVKKEQARLNKPNAGRSEDDFSDKERAERDNHILIDRETEGSSRQHDQLETEINAKNFFGRDATSNIRGLRQNRQQKKIKRNTHRSSGASGASGATGVSSRGQESI